MSNLYFPQLKPTISGGDFYIGGGRHTDTSNTRKSIFLFNEDASGRRVTLRGFWFRAEYAALYEVERLFSPPTLDVNFFPRNINGTVAMPANIRCGGDVGLSAQTDWFDFYLGADEVFSFIFPRPVVFAEDNGIQISNAANNAGLMSGGFIFEAL